MTDDELMTPEELVERASDVGDLVELLALCMWREARGEGEEGMRAVGHVVMKRAATWYRTYAEPVHMAIMYRGQFTSMSDPRDPEYRLHPVEGDPQYAFCRQIALLLIAGTDPDITKGALYYANLEELKPNCWFIREIVAQPTQHPELARIFRQTFYA